MLFRGSLGKTKVFELPENGTLTLLAEQELQRTSGSDIPAISRLVSDINRYGSLAALRNGDVVGGLAQMLQLGYGTTASFRDRQIGHAKLNHQKSILQQLIKLLAMKSLGQQTLSATLVLCGFITDSELSDALSNCWKRCSSKEMSIDLLADFLWALSMCCNEENAEQLLEPICLAWEKLPDSTQEDRTYMSKDDLAANGVRFGFARTPPVSAIKYYTKVARSGRLQWQIAYMLSECDQWDAVKFIVETGAEFRRKDHWIASSSLLRSWDGSGGKTRRMSSICRDNLMAIFIDKTQDEHLRKVALGLWAANVSINDCATLNKLQIDSVLSDDALRKRLAAGDLTATSLFLNKFEEKNSHWSFYLRFMTCPNVTKFVAGKIAERATALAGKTNSRSDLDYHLSNYLTRLSEFEVEEILSSNWNGLRSCARYVQAAVYCATPITLELATQAINSSKNPQELFKLFSSYFGILHAGHPGITRRCQIEALEPFINSMEDRCLSNFSNECNRKGWYDLREKLFDDVEACQGSKWSKTEAIQEFSEQSKREHPYFSFHIDRALEKGISWEEYFQVLLGWYETEDTTDALDVICSAVRYIGSREDFEMISLPKNGNQKLAGVILQDTEVAVKYRTLN